METGIRSGRQHQRRVIAASRRESGAAQPVKNRPLARHSLHLTLHIQTVLTPRNDCETAPHRRLRLKMPPAISFQFVPPRKGKFHIINTWHRGDALLLRPMINFLKQHFDLTLECTADAAYLWADLGLPIFHGRPGNPTHDSPLRPPDAHGVNLWFGTYDDILNSAGMTVVNHALTFNRRMEELQLPWRAPIPTEPAPVDFPPAEPVIRVKPNSILVENGPALSNQSIFDINPCIAQLAADFPAVNFYCASPPPVAAPNVFDVSTCNLIQLSHIGDQCAGFITRGSGVNAACYTRTSMFKPRCILGWTYTVMIWHNRADLLYTFGQMREFVKKVFPA